MLFFCCWLGLIDTTEATNWQINISPLAKCQCLSLICAWVLGIFINYIVNTEREEYGKVPLVNVAIALPILAASDCFQIFTQRGLRL